MQSIAAALGALALVVGFTPVTTALSAAALSTHQRALSWLRGHPQPQQDDLAELKSQNPEAYAIVQALLTKRSLGLLDPKHPTASFAATPPPAAQDDEASGPEAFQRFAGSTSSVTMTAGAKPLTSTELEYPEAPAAAQHHDWLNWKPHDSAADSDEAMVQSVLSAAASLPGNPLRGADPAAPAAREASPLAAEEAVFDSHPQASSAAGATSAAQGIRGQPEAPKSLVANSMTSEAALAVPAAPADEAEPVSSAITASTLPAAPKTASSLSTNPYLADSGLAEPAPPAGGSYLASFSWDDDKPASGAGHAAPTKASAPTPTAKPQAHPPASALSTWLGVSVTNDGSAAKPTPKVSQATAAPENPYLATLA